MTTFKANDLVIPLVLSVLLATPAAFAGGSHSGGHGHEKGHGHKTGHAHGKGHAHGHAQKIDYSDVEEHEFGKASDPSLAKQTIEVDMTDNLRFNPDIVTVDKGDTVRFVVRNRGRLMHEMVLGTDESLTEHAKLMQKFPGMEHDEPHMAHVSPGGEHVMGWQFTKSGEFHFGCLVPGHFEGGMRGKIVVR